MKLSILKGLTFSLLKRAIKIVLTIFLSLILIVISSLFILTGTDKGFHFVMDQASEMTSGALKFSQIEGNLLGKLNISDLHYADTAMEVSAHNFIFNWQPTELFSGQLLLNTIEINGIKFNQLIAQLDKDEEKINDEKTPLKLPEVSLPIDILLKKLQITDINLISAPGAKVVHIDTIRLRSELIKTTLSLQELFFQMPEVQALINGQAELHKSYPLDLQSDVKLTLPEQPELTLKGNISGDLEQLNIKQQIAGMLDASVDAQAKQLLGKLEWTSDIVLSRFELSPYLPKNDLPENGLSKNGLSKKKEVEVRAKINAKGDLTQAIAHIKTQIVSDKTTISRNKKISETALLSENVSENKQTASVEKLPQQAQITLDLDITFADQQFKVSSQWQNLQWPLSGNAAFNSKTGSLNLSGIPDNYILASQLALSGNDVPAGNWNINAKGGLSQINIDSLQGATLNGTIDITSRVSWGDTTQWQAKLHTKDIDPGQFIKQWPGSINIDLQSQGELSGDKLKAHIVLEQFSGHLRQQPLKGGGEFDLLNQAITIKQFKLSSGDAKLEVHGKVGGQVGGEIAGKVDEQLDLNWLVDIKQLSDLLPDSQGNIKGQGHISGTIKLPVVKAKLKLNNIAYDTIKLVSAKLDADINSDTSINSKLELSAQELNLSPDNDISKLSLSLKGPLANHQLKLYAAHTMASLSLDTRGKLDMEQSSWDGTIKLLTIDSPDFGKWSQTKPADLYASAEKILLSSLCLKEQSTILCTEADWTPEKGKAKLNLKDLSFERAKPYLPEEMTQLTGALNLNADIDLAPQLLANINADIKPGKLVYQPVGTKAIELAHRNGFLKAQYDAKQLNSKWNIEIGPHTISGKLNVPRDAIEKDPLTAPMNGQVKIQIKDFNIVQTMVPQIDEIEGHLLTDLKLGGLLGEPRVSGHAELIAPYVKIQDLGLRMENISLNIDDKNNGKELAIKGSIDSGKGQLKVDGLVVLDAQLGWPVNINLIGENFLVIDTPDIYAIISPDIQFSQKKELIKLRGKLLIPEATIAPSGMDAPQGSIGPSDDVIIIGEEEKTPLNMDLDVTLALGDEVKIDAYGLKTHLTGGITINQAPKQIMTAHGELQMKKGTFRAYGQDLSIEKGKVYYAGGFLDNPGIELRAIRKINTDQVGISVTGSAKDNNITTFSDDPTLSDKDRVSLLLTGQKSDNMKNAKIYAGKQINDKLSVGINAGAGDEGSEFVTRYNLTEDIQLEGTSSSQKSGGSILYNIELE